MKTFDYRDVALKQFVLVLGDTIQVWKQLLLFPTHIDLVVQHQASCGYVAIHTKSADAVISPRDLVKLVGGGQAHLLFDIDATVTMNYWRDTDLYTWCKNKRDLWHVVHRSKRDHVCHG